MIKTKKYRVLWLHIFFQSILMSGAFAGQKDASFIDHKTISDQMFGGPRLDRSLRNLSSAMTGRIKKSLVIYSILIEPLFEKLKLEFNFETNFSKFKALIEDTPIREYTKEFEGCDSTEDSCAKLKTAGNIKSAAIFVSQKSYQNNSYNTLFETWTQAGVQYFRGLDSVELRKHVREWTRRHLKEELNQFEELLNNCGSMKINASNIKFLFGQKLIRRANMYWFECGRRYADWILQSQVQKECSTSHILPKIKTKTFQLKDVYIPNDLGDIILCGNSSLTENTAYQADLDRRVRLFRLGVDWILILPESACNGKTPTSVDRLVGSENLSVTCKEKIGAKESD